MRFEQVHDILPTRLISPVSIGSTSAVVSEVIDTKGYDAVTLVILLGALNDLAGTTLIEDSDASGSGFAAVADTYLVGNLEANLTVAADDDNKVAAIGYRGDKRYVRVTFTPSTASGANLFAAVALLGLPQKAPVTVPAVA